MHKSIEKIIESVLTIQEWSFTDMVRHGDEKSGSFLQKIYCK